MLGLVYMHFLASQKCIQFNLIGIRNVQVHCQKIHGTEVTLRMHFLQNRKCIEICGTKFLGWKECCICCMHFLGRQKCIWVENAFETNSSKNITRHGISPLRLFSFRECILSRVICIIIKFLECILWRKTNALAKFRFLRAGTHDTDRTTHDRERTTAGS